MAMDYNVIENLRRFQIIITRTLKHPTTTPWIGNQTIQQVTCVGITSYFTSNVSNAAAIVVDFIVTIIQTTTTIGKNTMH